jgi:hypothetical protein
MYRRALAVSGVAIALSIVAMSPMFAASASTTPSTLSIAQVQGTGEATPYAGRTVTVHGVVTAILPSFGGLFIQSETPSGIEGASDGIFVDTTDTSYSAGDLVSVTGVAGEAEAQTQIVAKSVALLTADAGLPAATPLSDSVVGAAREAFEGMLVTPTGTYYLDSIDNPHGSLVLSAGTKTADAAARVTLDDGYNGRVAAQPYLLSDTAIRPGDTLVAPARPLVLEQDASGFCLQPTVRLTVNSNSAYKPKFTADSPRLNSAPVVAP